MLFSIILNDKLYHFKEEISILEACNSSGIKLPRFCYHENLSIAGNCRMCLVEIEKSIKPVVACSTEIINNMVIFTNSPLVLKSRENILEMLLLNHPLDCPICDQGGECDLQDQAIFFGSTFSRNYFSKRSVEDKSCSNIIKTIMNRCIHCTRCVRFGEEICGVKFFGTLNRGLKTEIGNYIFKLSISKISANVVDLCPVGALTLKSSAFKLRPWEIFSIAGIDLTDSLGTNIYLLYKGSDILRVVPKYNALINDSWISDKARFYYHISYKPLEPFLHLDFLNCQQFTRNLFLFNSNNDLETLLLFKHFSTSYNSLKNNFKLLNKTSIKTNFYFWGTKSRITYISNVKKSVYIFLASNLDLESPVLNIRLRSKIVYHANLSFSIGPFFKSTFPTKFLKFSTLELLILILGKNLILSKLILNYILFFFSSKAILDRLDCYLLKIFSYKIPQNFFFNIAAFCNTESSNFLNFSKFNLKEIFFSKNIFLLNLNDTFLLRKLLFFNKKKFWINQFSSNILTTFFKNSWVKLDRNLDSGVYLNLEQRPQLMSFIKEKNIFNIFNFISLFFKSYLEPAPFNFKNFFFDFSKKYYKQNHFLEASFRPLIFNFNNFNFFFEKLFYLGSFFFLKMTPLKLVVEDPYRTNLSFKYSPTLLKSSQILRKENLF